MASLDNDPTTRDSPRRCPVCDGIVTHKVVGALVVYDCPSCGHGHLEPVERSNDRFEGAAYVTWRGENRDFIHARARDYVDRLIHMMGRVPRTAAEIGCATGEALGLLAERGARCWGVDTSRPAIEAARRSFPKVDFEVALHPEPGMPVEAVLMLHVLEHIAEPIEVLRSARDLLHRDGALYLRLPNYGGLPRRVLRGAWPDYLPDHLHYFTKRSLALALSAAGFRVDRITTRGQGWAWLGGLKRAASGARPGPRPDGTNPPVRRMKMLHAAERYGMPLWAAEGRLGVGNELIALARPDPASI